MARRLVLSLLFVAVATLVFFAPGLPGPEAPAGTWIAPFLIPVIVAGLAYAAGAITLTSFLITAALSVLSFVAQSLLKPAASATRPDGTGSIQVDNKTTVRQPTAPRKVWIGRVRGGGVFGLMHSTENNWRLLVTILLAGHRMNSILKIWADDEEQTLDGDGKPTEGRFFNHSQFKFHLGTDDQAADSMLLTMAPDIWTADHRLRGIAYVAGALLWTNYTILDNTKVWNGIPNYTVVAEGLLAYDPRTGLTAYTNNSALIVAWYLCDSLFGRDVDYATGIDETALIAAANACDELVTLKGGGTEKRYTTNGTFLSDASPDEILGRLCGAMMGMAVYDGDRWVIHAGVYRTPTRAAITDNDMRAPSRLQTLTTSQESYNIVKGTYSGGEANDWNKTDFSAVRSEAMIAADGGVPSSIDIELPFTDSDSRCQRIAKIHLLQARQEQVEHFHGNLSLMDVRVGDVVLRTSTRYGWTNKPFEVRRFAIVVEESDAGPVFGVNLDLQETDPSVYDWTSSEEATQDPAPNTNHPNVFEALPVSNLAAVEELYSSLDGGGIKSMLTVSYDPSVDAFVHTGGGYRGSYRPAGATDWIPATEVTPLYSFVITDLAPGFYDIQVEAINHVGNPASAVSIAVEVIGPADEPDPVTNFTVQAHDTFALARWDLHEALDVREGGSYLLRHSSDPAATWDEMLTMAEDVAGQQNFCVVALVAGRYGIKARDATGHLSGAVYFAQTQSSVHTFVTVASSVEHPTFAGTKVNCEVDGGVLVLSESGGAILPSGTYRYPVMDLGSVRRVRLTNYKEAAIVNAFDDFDARPGPSDDWPAWDGEAVGDEGDSWLMVRHTSDDPGGSPTWSAWERLYASVFEARAFDFERQLVSYDAAYTPAIVLDTVVAEEVTDPS